MYYFYLFSAVVALISIVRAFNQSEGLAECGCIIGVIDPVPMGLVILCYFMI